MRLRAFFVLVLAAVSCMAHLAEADTLNAVLQFTVPTSGTPASLSFDQQPSGGTWSVLYRDTGQVSFFSGDGGQVASFLPDLSSLSPPYQTPQYADILNFGFSSCIFGLVGNPSTSLPGTVNAGHYDLAYNVAFTTGNTLVEVRSSIVTSTTQSTLARWEPFRFVPSQLGDRIVMLSGDGQTVYLSEDGDPNGVNWCIFLPNRRINVAQSVTFRYSDLNPVVLHDNTLTVLKRKTQCIRTGGTGGVPLMSYEDLDTPDSEVGDVIVTYQITGLPVGASLIDVDNVFCWADPNFVNNDRYFVLDQTTGGVYMLLPEAAQLPGDANNDGVVDAADYIILKRNVGQSANSGPSYGDFNNSGDTDWADLQIQAGAMSDVPGQSPAAPEPATLGLLALGALTVVRRRRRSCLRA